MDLMILFIICFLGSIIQGATGFGYAIFTMAVLPFFIPFKTAVIIVLLSSFIMTNFMTWRLKKHVNVKMLIFPVIATFIGRTIGIRVLMRYNENVLKIFLGVILILLAIYFIYYSKRIYIQASSKNGFIAGLFSGLLGGLFNIGGPPLVLYFLSAAKDKMEYNGTIQATFAIGGLYSIFVHIFYGNITISVLEVSIIGVFAVIAGSFIGLKIFKILSKETINKLVYSFMIVMGIMLVVR